MPGLTFADAYLLRKKSEDFEGNFGTHKGHKNTVPITNIADMDAMMHKIIRELGDEVKGTTKNIKSILKDMPPHFVKHVTEWHDRNDLDLLHHFILNNRYDLINFILGETNYFPVGYLPPSNPYAHLAAFMGYVESLRAILHYRPGAYFRTDHTPSHVIKLPDTVMQNTRLKFAQQAIPKGAEKFLQKIKHSALHAETMMQIFQRAEPRESDITAVLNTELGALEKAFKSNKRLPAITISSEKLKQDWQKAISKEKQTAVGGRSMKMLQKTAWYKKKRRAKVEDKFLNHFRRRLEPENETHCITVFWDAFSGPNEKAGVVNRAGDPVKIRYAPHAHYPRPHIDLDRLNFALNVSSETPSPLPFGAIPSKGSPRHSHERSSFSSNKATKVSKKPSMRGNRKNKEIIAISSSHTPEKDIEKYINKTPLSYAAERGHTDCVQYLLETVVTKRHPSLENREPLTLATKARSPESIMLLLERKTSRSDYQSAVILSIREMYPDCLTALLTNKGKDRYTIFDGTNLYHILYSQSVISSKRYELMPEMTRALVSSKEDVNSHGTPRTYPMYTLINCAFNITVGKQIFFFIDCLHILLECKANPHFDETKSQRIHFKAEKFTRQAYNSAISCVFESAKNSVNFFESTYWSNLFMKKFITTIEMFDLTPRRILNNILFDYMEVVCVLGLDRTIVRCLLRYGGNPDVKKDGKYSINVYFDQIFPYLTKFEIGDTHGHYKQELNTLMIIAKSMSLKCLSEALLIFLTDHLLSAPIQALPISREFASLMSQMVHTPRPLKELVVQYIWLLTARNKKNVIALPIPETVKALIIP
ncbi:hypothetical protein RRG08_035392 [Elysia crispata]|uniref:Uncharacterized protein n=1 Tax=Elysia crispata TaxID=231223 RepID=A0AAE1CS21_9GAST|nr:hypothetical protein RRG08_035392 [Elysia crispata]